MTGNIKGPFGSMTDLTFRRTLPVGDRLGQYLNSEITIRIQGDVPKPECERWAELNGPVGFDLIDVFHTQGYFYEYRNQNIGL